VVVTLVLVVNLVTEARAFLAVRPVAPLIGLESRPDYLARRLGSYSDAMRYVNDQLPAQARLLFLWEPRGYYCQPPILADTTLDNLAQLRVAHGEAQVALAALQADGFTHLLLHRAGLEFIQEPTPRPPALSTLFGQPSPEQSLYPLTDNDLRFLDDLLAHCQTVGNAGAFYEIYQLP
jgi:hypothetical protein